MKVSKGLISTFVLIQIVNAYGIRISQIKCLAYQLIVPSRISLDGKNASKIADPKEFQFMAKVYIGNSTDRYHNGMLISENFVLTVAYYTMTNRTSNGTHVVLGDYVNRTDIRRQRLNVIQYFQSDRNQLLLLKLNGMVKFNQYIRPVCLHQPKSNVSQSLLEIGWGIKNVLRKEKWNLLANAKCNETNKQGADKSRVCATTETKDCGNLYNITRVKHLYFEGCALLSGRRQMFPRNELVGIKMRTNTSSNCVTGHPKEFARISAHIDWIEKKVWPSSTATETYSSLHLNIVLLLTALVNYCCHQF